VILALVGFVNVPIIKFSVDWWNTLHQPASVLRMEGPSIDTAMLVPLLLMATGFTFYFASVLIVRIRSEIVARKIHNLRLLQVGG
jgi:heme exporter protein C